VTSLPSGDRPPRRARPWPIRWGYLLAVVWVLLATLALLPFRGLVGSGQWGWPYLLVVGLVAGTSGVGPALLAAGLSFLAENFFFVPPYGSLAVHSPTDLLQLAAFLVVAGAWGWQAGRLRERQLQSLRDEAEAEALLALAARVASETSVSSMAAFIGGELRRLVGATRTVVWVSEGSGAVPVGATGLDPDDLARSRVFVEYVLREAKAVGLPARRPVVEPDLIATAPAWPASVGHADVAAGAQVKDVFLPLHTSAGLEGVLQVGWPPGEQEGLGDRAWRLMVSADQMIAAFLTNRRLITTEAQADAVREADRLKTALLSSVSHELKTPLASIKAAVTDLSMPDVPRDETQVRERLGSVAEDLDRLETSIGDLLDTSRLEAGQWTPRAETWEAGEIVADVVSRLAATDRRRIAFDVPEPGPTVQVDFAQLSRALTNLVGNALMYAPQGDRLTVGARREGARTLLWVEDHGPGVSAADAPHVFEKFYRGAQGRGRAGSTGLGLSMASEIVRANDGTITLESVRPTGARFVISLPSGSGDRPVPDEDEGS
jgi:two-component system sensor histidine kinase KdpD